VDVSRGISLYNDYCASYSVQLTAPVTVTAQTTIGTAATSPGTISVTNTVTANTGGVNPTKASSASSTSEWPLMSLAVLSATSLLLLV